MSSRAHQQYNANSAVVDLNQVYVKFKDGTSSVQVAFDVAGAVGTKPTFSVKSGYAASFLLLLLRRRRPIQYVLRKSRSSRMPINHMLLEVWLPFSVFGHFEHTWFGSIIFLGDETGKRRLVEVVVSVWRRISLVEILLFRNLAVLKQKSCRRRATQHLPAPIVGVLDHGPTRRRLDRLAIIGTLVVPIVVPAVFVKCEFLSLLVIFFFFFFSQIEVRLLLKLNYTLTAVSLVFVYINLRFNQLSTTKLQKRYFKIDFFTRTGDEVGTGKAEHGRVDLPFNDSHSCCLVVLPAAAYVPIQIVGDVSTRLNPSDIELTGGKQVTIDRSRDVAHGRARE